MKNQKRLDNKGFSLVELIVVIAIMAVLMGVLAPTLIGNIEKSRESTDLQNLDTIRGAAVTAMANEAAYKDVMAAMGSNTKLVIDLGSSASAAVTGIGPINGHNNFQDEMNTIITSSIAMKSSAACKSGNNVKIIITNSGNVTVAVVDSTGAIQSCTKTKDENGNKQLMSGAGDAANS